MEYPTKTQDKILYMYHWQKSSANLETQGCYDWMCEQIQEFKPRKILEIGCGSGQGLKAILKNFPEAEVVSIEENFACIMATADLLRDSEITIYERLFYETVSGGHQIHVDSTKLSKTSQVTLIHGDVLLDDVALQDFIRSLAPFDAVVVWLMGTYMFRQDCVNLRGLGIRGPEEYRLRCQNKCYELADKILKPGGVLQIVDRGIPVTSEDIKNEMMEAHRDQASVTSLTVTTLNHRPYKEANQGVSMVSRDLNRAPTDLELTSVISTKPTTTV